jgi:hypothetical protein
MARAMKREVGSVQMGTMQERVTPLAGFIKGH